MTIGMWLLLIVSLQDVDHQVVRAYFPPDAELAGSARWGLPLALDRARGFVIFETDSAGIAALRAAGFHVEIDHALSAVPRREATSGGGINGYPCYPTVAEIYAEMDDWEQTYPQLAAVVDIGDSWEKSQGLGGHDLRVLVIGNQQITTDKPALFIMSGLHPRELAPTGITTRFARELLAGYGRDGDITWLLDHSEIHLLFVANPDGRVKVEADPPFSQRKNTNNQFCTGTSSRGVDLNRNFAFQWGSSPTCSSTGQCDGNFRGPAPASESEISAVQVYLQTLFPDQRGPGVDDPAPDDAQGLFLDLHAYSRQVLWPYGFDTTFAPNHTALTTLGRKLAWSTAYSPEKASASFDTCGTSDDFAYGDLGIAAYTFEIGDFFFEPCENFEAEIWPRNREALLTAARMARAPYLWPAGPLVETPQPSSSTLAAGDSLRLEATASDDRFQAATHPPGVEPTQVVVAAEIYQSPPWQDGALGTAMSPSDGAFDQETERVEGSLDTSAWALGEHLLYIVAEDAAGDRGAPIGTRISVVDPAEVLTVGGRVRSLTSGEPLAALLGTGDVRAASDPHTGGFLTRLAPGSHDLTVSAPGYREQQLIGVSGGAGAVVDVDILLVPVCSGAVDPDWAVAWQAEGDWSLLPAEAGSLLWDDSPEGDYRAGEDASLTSPYLEGGAQTLVFSRQNRLDPYGSDVLLLEGQDPSGQWRLLSHFRGDGGPGWREERVALDEDLQRVRFRLSTDGAFNHEGCRIKGLGLIGDDSCILPQFYENWPNNGVHIGLMIPYLSSTP